MESDAEDDAHRVCDSMAAKLRVLSMIASALIN